MIRLLVLFMVFGMIVSCKKEDISNDTGVLTPVNSLTEYETQIKTGVTLVFFHATWCTICKSQRPAVEGLTTDTQIKGAKLIQVDTDNNKNITTKYDVPGQPVILIYKDNAEKHRLFGSGHSQEKLRELIKALL